MTVPKPLLELHPKLCRAKYGKTIVSRSGVLDIHGDGEIPLRAEGTRNDSWFFYDKEIHTGIRVKRRYR